MSNPILPGSSDKRQSQDSFNAGPRAGADNPGERIDAALKETSRHKTKPELEAEAEAEARARLKKAQSAFGSKE